MLGLYRNNLKNRFLTALALPQHFDSHSRLASGNGRSLRIKMFRSLLVKKTILQVISVYDPTL